MVFVPTRDAPKGYIKLWKGDHEYVDMKLAAYKVTLPVDGQEAQRMADEYRRATGRTNVKLGERLRNYQVDLLDPIITAGEPGAYEAVKNAEGHWVIRDSSGQVVSICTTDEMLSKRLKQLTSGVTS
jgi:hypothetical protein